MQLTNSYTFCLVILLPINLIQDIFPENYLNLSKYISFKDIFKDIFIIVKQDQNTEGLTSIVCPSVLKNVLIVIKFIKSEHTFPTDYLWHTVLKCLIMTAN